MLKIELNNADTQKWTNADWKDGFLRALRTTVGAEFQMVVVYDDQGGELARYARRWQEV